MTLCHFQTGSKAKIYAKKFNPSRQSVSFGHFTSPPALISDHATLRQPELPHNIGDVQKQAERILLNHFSPTGVVVNAQLEVLQFRGRTGQFLEHAQGEASLNLVKMAREGLSVDLHAAVSKAIKQNIRVRHEGGRIKQNDRYLEVTIDVVPFQVRPSREYYYLVMLETPSPAADGKEPGRKAEGRKGTSRGHADSVMVNRLREELASTRDSLQAVIEEQEATNEELRSANEEIMSSNEELQSTNEELETAKEELQSTNEELTTLNEELENRNSEMDGVNNDLLNVLGSVNIPMLILGRDLRIRRFTAVAEKLFNLIPTDVGRPVTDIALKIEIPALARLVADVIDSLGNRDIEVRDKEGRWWSVRIRPYKTTDNRIEGAVVALVDIDSMKNRNDAEAQTRLMAEGLVNIVREPLMIVDSLLLVKQVNEGFLRAFKVAFDETIGRQIYDLGNGQWDIPRLRELLEEILPNNTSLRDFPVTRKFPRLGRKKMLLNARRLTYENGADQMILISFTEATDKKAAPRP